MGTLDAGFDHASSKGHWRGCLLLRHGHRQPVQTVGSADWRQRGAQLQAHRDRLHTVAAARDDEDPLGQEEARQGGKREGKAPELGAVMARISAMKVSTEKVVVSDGLNMSPRRPAKAYERLHNLSVRKRVEDVNLKPAEVTPFSSFPQSPRYTGGLGNRIN